LVDKLVIGLLLAMTAYLASRALESYKKRQALAGEIAKQRVQKMAEVWEHLSEWDFLIEELLRQLAQVAVTQHPDDFEHFIQQRRLKIIGWSVARPGKTKSPFTFSRRLAKTAQAFSVSGTLRLAAFVFPNGLKR